MRSSQHSSRVDAHLLVSVREVALDGALREVQRVGDLCWGSRPSLCIPSIVRQYEHYLLHPCGARILRMPPGA
jgi:hypothetical protein